MIKDYSDIINLPHHISPTHPPMDLKNRAAQFAPYAALTGYSELVCEEGRITSQKPELTNESKTILNEKLKYVLDNKNIEIEITYFIKDQKKAGGMIISKVGIIKKLDQEKNLLILCDKTLIPLNDLLDIRCDIFDKYLYE